MKKFKVISNSYDPTYENFEKFGEFVEVYGGCPCRAIHELKSRDFFDGYILNIETFELYKILNELTGYGPSQTQIYIKILEK